VHRIVPPSSRRRLTSALRAFPWAALLGASFALVAPSCRPAQPPPALATGERPVTGVARYDGFFADVGAVRDAVDAAQDEDNEARQTLARRLGLPHTAPIDAIGTRLRERTARWASEGLTLELEFTGIDDVDASEAPEAGAPDAASAEPDGAGSPAPTTEDAAPSATLRTPGREPHKRELRLLEALAQAALSGATVYANMGRTRRRVEHLEAELTELRGQASSAFANSAERDRVRAKLDEAADFLPELKARARETGGSADALISVLEEAANTVPVVPGRRRPAAPPAKATEPKMVAPAPRAPSASGAAAPSAAPSPTSAAPSPRAPAPAGDTPKSGTP
jgi:hypothetical protein